MSINDFPSALQPKLQQYVNRPKFFETPGKQLSKTQAAELFMYLIIEKQLEIADSIDSILKKIDAKQSDIQVNLNPTISGVPFWLASSNTNTSSIEGATAGHKLRPTLAFAVVLYRLASALSDDWGATRIIWGGVGTGSNKTGQNCHDWGTCLDFYGAITSDGAFDVKKDWANKDISSTGLASVYKPDMPSTKSVYQKNTGDVWDIHDITFFRLDPSSSAFTFFNYIYSFATRECSDGSNDAPTVIGDKSFIVHPDHPDSKLRLHHSDHMHMQIGKTGATV